MTTRNISLSLWALAALVTAGAASAESNWHFDVDASAGAQYDSNAGVADLDTSSGEADSIVLLAAGGSLTWTPDGTPISLRAGYDYSGTSHGRFETFDLDLHHAVTEVQYRNAYIDAALAFDRYGGVLDGEHYVTISQVSPSVAHLFGSRVYVRGAWIGSTRDYDYLPERAAKGSAVRLDSYLLLDNLDRYVSLGVQFNDERAASREFDFEGLQVSVAYAHTLELPLMKMKLKGSARYETRDYVFALPGLGEPRQDRRWRAGVEAEVPFSDHVSLHANLEHTNNASNLDTAGLDKNVAGLELRVAF